MRPFENQPVDNAKFFLKERAFEVKKLLIAPDNQEWTWNATTNELLSKLDKVKILQSFD